MRTAPFVDRWTDWTFGDVIEAPGGPIDQGIDAGLATGRGREAAGSVTERDREGLGMLVRLIAHVARDARIEDWTAERFVVEVTKSLIQQHPLLPRLAALLELDDVASDACGTVLPRGVHEAHRGDVRASLDRVGDELRAVIRSRAEVVDTYSLEYLEELGVWGS